MRILPDLTNIPFSGHYLNMRTATILFLASILLGSFSFMHLEGYTFSEGIYMAIITISTVGYTEVRPLSDAGRLFASIYILLNIGVFAYGISAFTAFVIEGEIFKKWHIKAMEKKIAALKNHIILCGFGRYGQEVVNHFLDQGLDFVVVERDHRRIEEMRELDERILYKEGDATHDEILESVGLNKARALISAMPDDSENVFTVLTARQINPKIQIVSRALNPTSQRKLRLAGANHVIMPEQIGGFYMATLISKPGAVDFFSFLTNQFGTDIQFEEVHFGEVPESCQFKSIRDLRIRKHTQTNVIGFKKPDGKYILNPAPETELVSGSSFIVLGTPEQLEELRKYLKNFPTLMG
ncbi:MAG: potassium channel protein [Bacteroidetes bacterium]|nr:potassium channel protein [Bacteroidota bacterium]